MHRSRLTTLIPTLAATALAVISLSSVGPALADDTPPANSAPGAGTAQGHHHNAAWKACKKQADDQNIAAGDARHEFMRNCMKSPNDAPPSAAP